MEEKAWVDFQAVKAAVSMRMVLDHYGINWLRKSGDDLVGRCPIHKGEGQRTISVSLVKNAFRCFSCKAKGNVLDFVAAMEGCTVREAAIKLQDWFHLAAAGKPKGERQERADLAPRTQETLPPNPPLQFALKGIDPGHPYLAERGIERPTADAFGVGFFAGRGLMSGRVVIPIHNAVGELVAYAGRTLDPKAEDRYRLPAGFHKSLELFNLHRAVKAEAGGRVIVVEGFFDCLKVHQAGFVNVVALMGCDLSAAQAQVLGDSFYEIVLMLDGDEAGQAAALECAGRLGRHAWVRLVEVPKNRQPDQLSVLQLHELLDPI